MLEVIGLSKKFDNEFVLKDVSFRVKDREILGILGPNGAGKTTLLRCIEGILIPDEGKVLINGINVTGNYEKALTYISFPFAEVPNPRMKVKEVIEYNVKIYELNKNYSSLCNLFEIELEKEFQKLSTGNERRVEILIGLLSNPSLFIMDETTNGLDPFSSNRILKEIKRISKKTSVIFASHIVNHVEKVASKILIMYRGRVLAFGSLKKLKKESDLKEYVKVTLEEDVRLKLKEGIPIKVGKKKYEVVTNDYRKVLKEIGKSKIIEKVKSIDVKKVGLEEVYSYFVSKVKKS